MRSRCKNRESTARPGTTRPIGRRLRRRRESWPGSSPKPSISGHGPALQGAELRRDLHVLAADFKRLAVPSHGRYVGAPARADLRGTRYVPPKKGSSNVALVGTVAVLAGGWLLYRGLKERRAVKNSVHRQGRGSRNEEGVQEQGAPEVERSLTVGRSAEELYGLWLEPGTLPKIMSHVAAVRHKENNQTHWQLNLPLGRSLEWDTHVTEERRDEFIHWASLAGAALPSEGFVRFRPAPADRGTVVTLRLEFSPPGGALGRAAAEQFAAVPKNLVSKALRRFKSLAETGEMPTLEHNPSARGRSDNV